MSTRGDIIRGAGGHLSRNTELGVGIGHPYGGDEGDIRVQMVEGSPRLYARAGGEWYGTNLFRGTAVDEFRIGSASEYIQITSGDIEMTGKISIRSTGTNNVVIGVDNLDKGSENIIIGVNAAKVLESGAEANVCIGFNSSLALTSGLNNVLIGTLTGESITSGLGNLCVGYRSGGNTLTTGTRNTYVGFIATASASDSDNEAVFCANHGTGAVTGKGDDTVLIGSSAVTDVYMGEDSQATVLCGKIGIGEASPGSALHISTHTSGTDTGPVLTLERDAAPVDDDVIGKIRFLGDNDGTHSEEWAHIRCVIADRRGSEEDGKLIFSTVVQDVDTDTMTIYGGNVGIGTATPDAKLEVVTSSASCMTSITTYDDTSTDFSLLNLRTARGTEASNSALQDDDYLGGISFYGAEASDTFMQGAAILARASETWSNGNNGTRMFFQVTPLAGVSPETAMTIKEDGNVGIGTTGPSEKLEVSGNILAGYSTKVVGGSGWRFIGELTGTNANIWQLGCDNNDPDFSIYEDTTKMLTVKTGGNVGIGTDSPAQLLDLKSVTSDTLAATGAQNLSFSMDGGTNLFGYQMDTAGDLHLIGQDNSIWYDFLVCDRSTRSLLPGGNKLADFGNAGNAWDDVVCDDVVDEADFYNFDEYDDLATLHQIKGSGKRQEYSGYELIDDDTLPDWLCRKYKKGEQKGEKMISPDGNPYLSLKTMISLLMGAVRQLDDKNTKVRQEVSAKVEALEAQIN